MKIAITGATSFLGINLLKELAQDNTIYCLVRRNSPNNKNLADIPNVIVIECNLEELSSFVPNFTVDVFIHFGWAGAGSKLRQDLITQNKNYYYSLDAINLAIRLKAKLFVFSGSQAEYGIKHSLITETDECNPKSYYGMAKYNFALKAASILKKHDINFLHLRIFSIYGEGDHKSTLINLCVNSFLQNKHIVLGPCTQLWNYLNILDFSKITSKVIEYVLDNEIDLTINIASHDTRVLREFIMAIYKICNFGGSYEFSSTNPNPEGLAELNPSTFLLDKIIGNYEFISFENEITKLVEATLNEN